MQRITTPPRADWQSRVAEYGLTFHTIEGETYWDERACYAFSAREVDEIEDATNALHALCLETVEAVIRQGRFAEFHLPEPIIPLVVQSWERRDPSLYGRFDFAYDGTTPPKLLEYNADTPTALLEASVIQWFWLQDTHPDADQFNSIHERLLERLRALQASLWPAHNRTFYFASVADHEEDYVTVSYLRDLAVQAGYATEYLTMDEIGWDAEIGQFVDLDGGEISMCFKLYPWEWMAHEAFAAHLPHATVQWIEPMWKMLLSNKALLPILWERYPDHPNLLPAAWTPRGDAYVRKPILAREGANVAIIARGQVQHASPGDYGDVPCIYQAWQPLPNYGGNYPVIGSWVVGDTACGMGIREDTTPITRNTSRFVPHLFTA